MADLHTAEDFNKKRAELEQDLKERGDDLPPANILVAGITGTGKSTLLNAVFGKNLAETGTGRPVTEHMSEYHSDDIPIRIWDTVGLELDSEKTRKSIGDICAKIAEMAEHPDPYDKVHAIWYCINSNSKRYQGAELEFIKELHSLGVPFIIVLTQCHESIDVVDAFQKEIEKINDSMGLNNVDVVQVMATPYEVRGPLVIEPFGLDELVSLTCKKLPQFIVKGFVAAQKVSQREKRAESEGIIYDYAEQAMKGFWDKVPIVNVFTTDDKIKRMFCNLGKMYNTLLDPEEVNKVIRKSDIDFHNSFWGLIAPFDVVGYSDKITALLERKKETGFTVEVAKIEKRERAARMIAFYGYTFIDSIEEVWEKSTETQLKDISATVNRLIEIINRNLRDRKAKVAARSKKK